MLKWDIIISHHLDDRHVQRVNQITQTRLVLSQRCQGLLTLLWRFAVLVFARRRETALTADHFAEQIPSKWWPFSSSFIPSTAKCHNTLSKRSGWYLNYIVIDYFVKNIWNRANVFIALLPLYLACMLTAAFSSSAVTWKICYQGSVNYLISIQTLLDVVEGCYRHYFSNLIVRDYYKIGQPLSRAQKKNSQHFPRYLHVLWGYVNVRHGNCDRLGDSYHTLAHTLYFQTCCLIYFDSFGHGWDYL